MPGESFISEAWGMFLVSPGTLAACFVVAFALVAVVIYGCLHLRRRRGGCRVAGPDVRETVWDAFRSACRRAGLSAQEERILTTMARNYFAHDPMTLLTDRAAFDRGVATLAAGLSQGSDKTLRQLEAVFAGLRKRLSYEADRGTHGLLTTRELRKGMEIEVIDKRTDRRLTGRVREVGELHFSVQIDHDAGSLRKDSVVSTRIARDHRMWEFETKIIHSWNELIDFAHDHSPDEVNRRFFRRAYFRSAFVYATLPLAIRGDGAARAAFRKARVVDISAGGVGVRLDEDLAPGTQLLMCIQVGAVMRGPLWCIGEVQRVQRRAGTFLAGIRMRRLSTEQEALLVRLVNETERQSVQQTRNAPTDRAAFLGRERPARRSTPQADQT